MKLNAVLVGLNIYLQNCESYLNCTKEYCPQNFVVVVVFENIKTNVAFFWIDHLMFYLTVYRSYNLNQVGPKIKYIHLVDIGFSFYYMSMVHCSQVVDMVYPCEGTVPEPIRASQLAIDNHHRSVSDRSSIRQTDLSN